MLVSILAALSFASPDELPSHGDESFCDRVELNHGCCPACGYEWRDGVCVTDSPATSAYCKSLLEPTHMGCCGYCHNLWDGSKCVHSATAAAAAAAGFRDLPLATFDGSPSSVRDSPGSIRLAPGRADLPRLEAPSRLRAVALWTPRAKLRPLRPRSAAPGASSSAANRSDSLRLTNQVCVEHPGLGDGGRSRYGWRERVDVRAQRRLWRVGRRGQGRAVARRARLLHAAHD